jgi:tetratricopeptide (TPR) repeat protein
VAAARRPHLFGTYSGCTSTRAEFGLRNESPLGCPKAEVEVWVIHGCYALVATGRLFGRDGVGSQSDSVCRGRGEGDSLGLGMFRQVRFECGACGEGFVDWHDDEWQRSAVFCVHCGARIVARGSLAPPAMSPARVSNEQGLARSLGVLKSEGEGFRDTLPGLSVAPGSLDTPHVADATSRDTEPTLPRAVRPGGTSDATSTAPNAGVSQPKGWALQRRSLALIAALLLGFAAGVPAALYGENPLLRLMNPAAYRSLRRGENLARVSSAIDQGHWDDARALLDRARPLSPPADNRVATLRARLALGLILANRPADAGRELSAVPNSSSLHPSAADLKRVYDAFFPSKPSAIANSSPTPTAASVAAPKAKPVVTRRELLSFARDRQHRAQLDDAERLYGEVLRTHPNDAEARCGLAEVQLLRGGTDDGAKLFERALADDASYSPAWVGLADVDWLRGRPERAACRYRAVIERFPAGSYPPYIAQRVDQVASSGVNPPEARTDVSAVKACDD